MAPRGQFVTGRTSVIGTMNLLQRYRVISHERHDCRRVTVTPAPQF
jgi:hypothetical protein